MSMITVERVSLPTPPVNVREVLRYAGGGEESAVLDCLSEAEGVLSFNVSFAILPVSVKGSEVDLGFEKIESRDLAKNLGGCHRAVLFAATVGIGMDRLIRKYARLSPSRAVLFQALGSERVESLCDAFEEYIAARLGDGITLRPRFSPGYGDLPLEFQREVFALLDCPKNLGISLSDSLLMTPEKSVTAIVGIVN